jgi:putative membrane protein
MGTLGPQEILLIIITLAIWGAIIGGIAWLVRYAVRAAIRESARASGLVEQAPLDILKQRYARGEITAEQYQQMKRTLES